MLPDRVSNPGPLTYESGALPIALRGPANRDWKVVSIVTGVKYLKEKLVHSITIFPCGVSKHKKKKKNDKPPKSPRQSSYI